MPRLRFIFGAMTDELTIHNDEQGPAPPLAVRPYLHDMALRLMQSHPHLDYETAVAYLREAGA